MQAGLRHDLNDRFADFTTWSLGASYALPGTGTRLRASIGTAVQNPTLFNQFGFIPGTFIGNPNLRPEQSRGWDIGFDQMLGAGTLSVTYCRVAFKSGTRRVGREWTKHGGHLRRSGPC